MNAIRNQATALASEVARASLQKGAARTLLLDLDGTLAPIAATPEEARVPHGTLESLRRLARDGWLVVIVSGRPAAEIRRLVPVRGVRVFGSHGAEGSWRGGTGFRVPVRLRRRLQALSAAVRRLSARVPGARVENKPRGLAFHDRNVARENLRAWRTSLIDLVAASDLQGLEVLRGRRVIELRVRGHQKGIVVRGLPRAGRPGRRDASLVAVGDDQTDEDLFEAVLGRGLSVRVGSGAAATLAARRLPSPKSVERFLRELAEASDTKRKKGDAR